MSEGTVPGWGWYLYLARWCEIYLIDTVFGNCIFGDITLYVLGRQGVEVAKAKTLKSDRIQKIKNRCYHLSELCSVPVDFSSKKMGGHGSIHLIRLL